MIAERAAAGAPALAFPTDAGRVVLHDDRVREARLRIPRRRFLIRTAAREVKSCLTCPGKARGEQAKVYRYLTYTTQSCTIFREKIISSFRSSCHGKNGQMRETGARASRSG